MSVLLEENPDGASDRLIGQALGVPEEDVEKLYEEIVEKLKAYVEELGKERDMTLQEFADMAEWEGLEYALLNCVTADRMEDPRLAKLIGSFQSLYHEIEAYLDENANSESSPAQ